jgi:Uma2 family endonuclease
METLPRVAPFDRAASYDDLLKLPDHVVGEIVDGELHASPRPAPLHAIAGAGLGGLIVPPYSQGRGGPGGWWILYEPELHLGPDVLVPDWAGWRRTQMPAPPPTAYFTVAPSWICEILSPSTVTLDRARKLASYAREQVTHAWLIDPIARTLEVLRLEDGRWSILSTHAGTETVRVEPFNEVEVELAALWGEPAGE